MQAEAAWQSVRPVVSVMPQQPSVAGFDVRHEAGRAGRGQRRRRIGLDAGTRRAAGAATARAAAARAAAAGAGRAACRRCQRCPPLPAVPAAGAGRPRRCRAVPPVPAVPPSCRGAAAADAVDRNRRSSGCRRRCRQTPRSRADVAPTAVQVNVVIAPFAPSVPIARRVGRPGVGDRCRPGRAPTRRRRG